MNKCWFILEQSFYNPPVYVHSSRAGGETLSGELRLGDVVPSPSNIYPVLTQGALPQFGRDMRITHTQLGEFKWDTTREREDGGNAGAGATLGAKFEAEFKKTMKTWANFKTVDIEVVQPTTVYIDEVLGQTNVQMHLDQQKLPFLDQWTVYMVIGLMIARTGGSVGSSDSHSQAFHSSTNLEIPGAAKLSIGGTHKNSREAEKSANIPNDRIWAVRFAKIHKGLFCRRWMQTEQTIGAALDGDEDGEEQVSEVLKHEGLENFEVVECTAAMGGTEKLSFVRIAP